MKILFLRNILNKMNCPKCDKELSVKKYFNTEVEYCQNCKGVWLDRGELAELLNIDKDIPRIKKNENIELTNLLCPVCKSAKLKRFIYHPKIPIIIEKCENCLGLWFDKDELQFLNKNIIRLKNLSKKNKEKLSSYNYKQKKYFIKEPIIEIKKNENKKNNFNISKKNNIIKTDDIYWDKKLIECLKPFLIFSGIIILYSIIILSKIGHYEGPPFIILFPILGIVFSVICIVLYIYTINFIFKANIGYGRVTGYKESDSTDSGLFYNPIVQFYTKQGILIEFVDKVSHSHPPKGEIKVLYNPDNPLDAKLWNWASIWIGVYCFGFFAITFVVISILSRA